MSFTIELEKWKANAALIAAAPDLLAALKLTAAMAAAGHRFDEDTELRPRLEHMERLARAAIAKAEGK